MIIWRVKYNYNMIKGKGNLWYDYLESKIELGKFAPVVPGQTNQ